MTFGRAIGILVAALALPLFVACGGGGGGAAPATPSIGAVATASPSAVGATSSAMLNAGSAPQTGLLATVSAGYAASVTVPTTSSGSGTVNLVLGAALPSAAPTVQSAKRLPAAIGGSLAPLAYVTFTSAATVAFPTGPTWTFTLPSNLGLATGAGLYVGFYDPTNASAGWTTFAGPGTVAGATVTFAGPLSPATFTAGTAYVFALFSTAQMITVPNPTPSSIAISAGGTYTGSWQSLNPKTPAVSINTTATVVIQNCTIQSKGPLIFASVANAHVTITNCTGTALDPLVAGDLRGNFFSAYDIGSLDVEHNSIQGVNYGVQLYDADGWAPSGPITIRYNTALNLQGAPSDGNGGLNYSNLLEPGDNQNHFVILADLQNLTGTDISWNYVESDPGLSTIGDVINIYSSSGTSASPINVHDNFILGGYPAVPNATTYYAGGIITDGNAANTAATATAFVNIYNNQVVSHANGAIGIAAGHDNQIYDNRVVSSGQLANGSWFVGYDGIGVIDCACYNQPPSVFFNNSAHDNTVGYQFEWSNPATPTVFSPPIIRQDYQLQDCAGGASGAGSLCINNASLPALPTLITSATEANETTLWQQKLSSNNITVGPTTTTSSSIHRR